MPMARTIWSPRSIAKCSRNMPCCGRPGSRLRMPQLCASKWRRVRKAHRCPAIPLPRTARSSQRFHFLDFRYTNSSQRISGLTENRELRTAFMTEKLLAVIFVFINSVISTTGYAGVMLLMAIESACIPLPSELIMPFAGYLVFQGKFNLLWVATAGAIGCNLGSLVAYEIGCYGGRPLVERYGRWILMGRRELDWADRFFQRWGYMAVFIARLLPVIRTFIALPAGIARMPRGKFHIYTFLGSWPWCFALAYLGMKLGENWRSLGKYFHKFDAIIGVLLLSGIVWFLWSHWQNRLRPDEE